MSLGWGDERGKFSYITMDVGEEVMDLFCQSFPPETQLRPQQVDAGGGGKPEPGFSEYKCIARVGTQQQFSDPFPR